MEGAVGRESDAGVGHREAGGLAGEGEVSDEGETHAGAGAGAVDRGDQGGVHAGEARGCGVQVSGHFLHVGGHFRPDRGEAAQVGAGAEESAGTSEDDGADVRIVVDEDRCVQQLLAHFH